jgi:hypothetical protein
VGPRSAHIAGLKYVSFTDSTTIPSDVVVRWIKREGEMGDYFTLEDAGSKNRWTITATCAANLLGLIPEGDYAWGDLESVKKAFALIETSSKGHSDCPANPGVIPATCPPEQQRRWKSGIQVGQGMNSRFPEKIMQLGAAPLKKIIQEFLSEKKLTEQTAALIGGGGGASVWLRYLGQELSLPIRLVDHAPVISAIGAAMAMLQETVERTLMDPTSEDLASIRQEAESILIRSGADPQTIEVRVELDREQGILRATAMGAHQMVTEGQQKKILSKEDLKESAALVLKIPVSSIRTTHETDTFILFEGKTVRKNWGGLFSETRHSWVVIERCGRVRLHAQKGAIAPLHGDPEAVLQRTVRYTDAGSILPAIFLITASRLIDFSGLSTVEQTVAMCHQEIARESADSKMFFAIMY